MVDVKLNIDEKGHGAFIVFEDGEQLGEMVVRVTNKNLTVYHTEVSDKAEGKGFAKVLLTTMVDYARKQHLKVIPLCPFVHAQFKCHPDAYADLWDSEQELRRN